METSEGSETYVELIGTPGNAFPPNTYLLSAGADPFVLVWDMEDKGIISSINIPNPPITKIISQPGSKNATLLSHYKVYNLDLISNTIIGSHRLTNSTLIGGFHSKKNSNLLLWVSETGSMGIKDFREKDGEYEVRITRFIHDHQVIEDERIVCLNESSELISFDIEEFVTTNQGVRNFDFLRYKNNNTDKISLDFNNNLPNSQIKEISQFCFAASGIMYYSSFGQKFYRSNYKIDKLNKYSISEEKLLSTISDNYSTFINKVHMGKDNDQVILGNVDGSIYRFSHSNLHDEYTMLDEHKQAVWDFQVKNNVGISCSTDSTIRMWDLTANINTGILHGHSKSVYCMYFSG